MSKLRTTMRNENDGLPIVIWLVSSFAVSLLVSHTAIFVLEAVGYTAVQQVTLVGGGAVSVVPMTTAEYYGGMAGPLVGATVFGLWALRDSLTDSDETLDADALEANA